MIFSYIKLSLPNHVHAYVITHLQANILRRHLKFNLKNKHHQLCGGERFNIWKYDPLNFNYGASCDEMRA